MLNRKTVKILLAAAAILVLCLSLVGCMRGSRPLGWSSAAIDGDIIYIATTQGKLVALDNTSQSIKFAVDIRDGSSSGGSCTNAQASVSVYGTPVIADGKVFIASYTGEIFAFNAENGASVWKKGDSQNKTYGKFVSGFVTYQDNIIIADDNGVVYAFSQDKGDLVWSYQAKGAVWATPTLFEDKIYLGDYNNNYYCLNASNGAEIWKHTEDSGKGAYYSQATVITTGDGQNLVIVGNFDRSMHAFNAQTGAVVWHQTEISKSWFWAAPVFKDNKIYAASLDGSIYILNPIDGSTIKSLAMGKDKKDGLVSSPVVVGDVVVAITQKGYLYSIDDNDNLKALQTDAVAATVHAPLATNGSQVIIHTVTDEKVIVIDPVSGNNIWSKDMANINKNES
ncbi:MAG: PQQ-binding-like beta-propeller repeat protein [Chloroflexi bacterium]|nr:PQQ-binding-like beta-propeller repeat protein [Chloroflexota bacterium]